MASPANTPLGYAGPPVKGGQLAEDQRGRLNQKVEP